MHRGDAGVQVPEAPGHRHGRRAGLGAHALLPGGGPRRLHRERPRDGAGRPRGHDGPAAAVLDGQRHPDHRAPAQGQDRGHQRAHPERRRRDRQAPREGVGLLRAGGLGRRDGRVHPQGQEEDPALRGVPRGRVRHRRHLRRRAGEAGFPGHRGHRPAEPHRRGARAPDEVGRVGQGARRGAEIAPRTLLAVDAGNTNLTLGLFRGARLAAVGRVETHPLGDGRRQAAAVARWARKAAGAEPLDAFVFGTVVPALAPALRAAARALKVRPAEVGPSSQLGLRLAVRTPLEVGADRVLNALAARALHGAPCVVVDFGTATTFDCVSRRGDYLGGAILPGPRLAAKALSLHTAKLPEVPVAPTRRVIGKDTVECIQAGLYWGYLGMIERVLAMTLAEMRAPRAKVVLTGGLAPLFAKRLPGAVHEADLTLHGLRMAETVLNDSKC
ncbi:type III pantothenate kinase [bacterium]|nr:MAG: type III pantothenate kinase [bacterium]